MKPVKFNHRCFPIPPSPPPPFPPPSPPYMKLWKHSWLVIALVTLSGPKIAPALPRSAAGNSFEVAAHFKTPIKSTENVSALHDAFEKEGPFFFKALILLFVCGHMLGRKPLSRLHRGLLCTLEQTITTMFSPQIYGTHDS